MHCIRYSYKVAICLVFNTPYLVLINAYLVLNHPYLVLDNPYVVLISAYSMRSPALSASLVLAIAYVAYIFHVSFKAQLHPLPQ